MGVALGSRLKYRSSVFDTYDQKPAIERRHPISDGGSGGVRDNQSEIMADH
jgi:hypothetical protein